MQIILGKNTRNLSSPVASSQEIHHSRTTIVLRIQFEDFLGTGELPVQAIPTLGDPGVEGVIEELCNRSIPMLIAMVGHTKLPQWSHVHTVAAPRASSRWAWALIELALLDGYSKSAGGFDFMPALQVPKILRVISAVGGSTSEWNSQGVSRVRMKVSPTSRADDIRLALGDWKGEVLLDYNASQPSLELVRSHSDVVELSADLVGVEQPYLPGDLARSAELQLHLGCTVAIDEGLRGIQDVRQIVRNKAAQLVCIKPPRVGGVAVARALMMEADDLGLRYYVGGFFDPPASRVINYALAASARAEASDISDVSFEKTEAKYEMVCCWGPSTP